MSLIVLDLELTEKKINNEVGIFIHGSVKGFSFCPPKTFKPNKQTRWNTNHLHGIAWSSGKLEYEKLFAVFYDLKVMKAEVSAKVFENCRLLTKFLGQNIENLDDYGCPKNQDLVREGKTNTSWICSSYAFRHKTRLHCASRIHFTFTTVMNKLVSTKNRIFISLVGLSDSGKMYLIHEWLKVGASQPKFEKIHFFLTTPSTTL